jgi:dienelactone hydrolase
MKDVGCLRCQKKLPCILTTGRLTGVTVTAGSFFSGVHSLSFRNAAIALGSYCLLGGCSTALGAQSVTLRLATIQREFLVTGFQNSGAASRPAVLVLSGAKGYDSTVYSLLATDLNASGIDVFLIHYISNADALAMESAGSARARIAYYAKRMPDWIETIRVTMGAIRRLPVYQSKIGVLGVSLGAMPVTVVSSNSSEIDASTIVDGSFPADFQSRVRLLPPLLMIWGSDDRVFPLSAGTKLRDLARSLGGAAELRAYSGEGHAFFLEPNNASATDARQRIVGFFSSELNAKH